MDGRCPSLYTTPPTASGSSGSAPARAPSPPKTTETGVRVYAGMTVFVKHGTHVLCLRAHERTGKVGFQGS